MEFPNSITMRDVWACVAQSPDVGPLSRHGHQCRHAEGPLGPVSIRLHRISGRRLRRLEAQ